MSVCLPGLPGMRRDKQGRWRSDQPVRAVLPVRMTEEDRDKLKTIAESMGKSPSILVREILMEWIEQWEQEEPQPKKPRNLVA